MILEYTFNEPKNIEKIKTQDDEFLIEILSWNNINQFSFNSIDRINFKVNMENNFVTTIIPKNFLAEPYQVLLNEEDIKFHKNFNNETHVWLNFKPQSSGDISIVGTLVPEIIIPEEPLDQTGIIVIGIIIVGLIIAGVFFYKRKK